jgi:plasmid stability protein
MRKRLQVLLTEREFTEIRGFAKRERLTVAAWVSRVPQGWTAVARTGTFMTPKRSICHLGGPPPARSEITMNLTLTNIPEEVYTRLKSAAVAHRRSLDSEAIVCLEAALLPRRGAGGERLSAARALRATLPKAVFRAKDIAGFKRQGRA